MGAIAGIVVAVAVAVLSAGTALFFHRRWKAAMATQTDLYRAYTLRRRVPESAGVAPVGFSSSLKARTNASALRSDTSAQAFSGRAPQSSNNHAARYRLSHGAAPTASGLRDSRSIVGALNSTIPSAGDEVRRFFLLFYCKNIECVYNCRFRDEGLSQMHPEVACH